MPDSFDTDLFSCCGSIHHKPKRAQKKPEVKRYRSSNHLNGGNGGVKLSPLKGYLLRFCQIMAIQ
jgi:hypothetical protein